MAVEIDGSRAVIGYISFDRLGSPCSLGKPHVTRFGRYRPTEIWGYKRLTNHPNFGNMF